MSEKEKLIREVSALSHEELQMLRKWMRSIRRNRNSPTGTGKQEAYLKVRKALGGIKGILSDDIARHRGDRV